MDNERRKWAAMEAVAEAVTLKGHEAQEDLVSLVVELVDLALDDRPLDPADKADAAWLKVLRDAWDEAAQKAVDAYCHYPLKWADEAMYGAMQDEEWE